ncbi:hypothetical protein KJ567_01140 [Candidatus Bipolaricaulota bacterium]|nr:hypothetical protein [Candidatus Bipolaricaulota bacterium]
MSLRTCALLGLVMLFFAAGTVAETISLSRQMPAFSQAYTDGLDAWGDCALGTGGCPDQICTTGCLVTAFASVLAYHGVEVDVPASASCTGRARSGMDPGILNDWLRVQRGYGRCGQDPIGDCCLAWDQLPDAVELTFHSNRSNVGLNPVASVVIDHALRQGNPVIAGVHWGASCNGGSGQSEDCHWVILTGKVGDTYAIVDPYNADPTSPYGIRTTLEAGVHGNYIIDRFVVVARGDGSLRPLADDARVTQPSGENGGGGSSFVVLFAVIALVAALVTLITVVGSGPTP